MIGYLLISLLYATLTVGVFIFERRRIRRSGADPITIFVILFLLQCCVPGIVIFGLLPFADPVSPTGNDVFDGILHGIDFSQTLLVLSLTAWFVIAFYGSCGIGQLTLSRQRSGRTGPAGSHRLVVRRSSLLLVLAAGVALTVWSFSLFGDSMMVRYANLVLFRAGFEGIERNALNANAFSLTQTWLWLSVLAFFASKDAGARWWKAACVVLIAVFALLGASRRALFLPVLLSYLTLLLYDNQWRARWVGLLAVPILVLLAFGKEVSAALAWGGSIGGVAGMYGSWVSAVLRSVSDLGITVVESLGTVRYLHLPMRFGVDHLVSIAHRFPAGTLGVDLHFPERMVRISTAALADPNSQDLPPGLLGQMWLDFGVFGPFIWGLVFGLQMSVLAYGWKLVQHTKQAAAVFVVLIFIVALPVNTGSFDFTFSVDVIAFFLVLVAVVHTRPLARTPA